jgi:RNA polymerase sigma-70 factor (ECF subfamily)
VTIRTALMGIRSRRRRSRREEAVLGTARADPEPVEERLAVQEALERMPEKLRLVFMLKEIEGYGHGEIADQLGISQGASSVRLSRAWAFLRRTLGGAS